MTRPNQKKVVRRLALAVSAMGLFFVLLGADAPQAASPLPSPSITSEPAAPAVTPISPSNTSTYITQIALLLVSAGGVLAAIPPIVRSFRKSDGNAEADAEQARIILAMAKILAKDDAERARIEKEEISNLKRLSHE